MFMLSSAQNYNQIEQRENGLKYCLFPNGPLTRRWMGCSGVEIAIWNYGSKARPAQLSMVERYDEMERFHTAAVPPLFVASGRFSIACTQFVMSTKPCLLACVRVFWRRNTKTVLRYTVNGSAGCRRPIIYSITAKPAIAPLLAEWLALKQTSSDLMRSYWPVYAYVRTAITNEAVHLKCDGDDRGKHPLKCCTLQNPSR